MPLPSSLTRIDWRPPSSTAMSIDVAPASIAFSISSFTTDAGRSTTSPAAIWSATALGRTAMREDVATVTRQSYRRGAPTVSRSVDANLVELVGVERDERRRFDPPGAAVVEDDPAPRALL